jgi:hypothetical protein
MSPASRISSKSKEKQPLMSEKYNVAEEINNKCQGKILSFSIVFCSYLPPSIHHRINLRRNIPVANWEQIIPTVGKNIRTKEWMKEETKRESE